MDLNDLGAGETLYWDIYDFMIRAVGHDGRFELDCNDNDVIDVCDIEIAHRATSDRRRSTGRLRPDHRESIVGAAITSRRAADGDFDQRGCRTFNDFQISRS